MTQWPRVLSTIVFVAAALRWGLTTAQEPDKQTPLVIHITAPLIEIRWQDALSGVTLIDDDDIGGGRAPLQPTDALNLSPGMLVQNRNNFAQNPRVSIRVWSANIPRPHIIAGLSMFVIIEIETRKLIHTKSNRCKPAGEVTPCAEWTA